jgi:hypothetical protein
MKTRHSYSYSILRYVHDVATSEFVNIGVVVHSREEAFFEVRCRPTYGRISAFFPDLNTKAFRALVKTVSARFNELSDAYAGSLDMEPARIDLDGLLTSVLPKDDSALAWSSIATGLSSDLKLTVAQLFTRYVTRYDHPTTTTKRTDDDVWRNFSRSLESRHIANYFTEKTIVGDADSVKFKSAWKNGVWHCIEPISFDLAASETIKEKARLFLGQMTSVEDVKEEFKLYIVLGAPSEPSLQSAYEKAVQIIKRAHVDKEIYSEAESERLAAKLQLQINQHEKRIENYRGNVNLD